MKDSNLIKIRPAIQHYAWGKLGSASVAARLSGTPIDETKPYAELWYGAHPNGPSSLTDGSALRDFISATPEANLGSASLKKFGTELPFLLKILSVGRPLSIQSHPSRSEAKKLRALRPEYYPDDNHKPERSIALTPLELLYGFRSVREIADSVERVFEFRELVQFSAGNNEKEVIKRCFLKLLDAEPEKLRKYGAALEQRLGSLSELTNEEAWALKLSRLHPEGDMGVFCPFILRYLQLNPFDSLFIGPNIPHAYLAGDLIECMGNSDNVIRCGLTPKPKDRDGIVATLDFHPSLVEKIPLTRAPESKNFQFPAHAEEFLLGLIRMNAEMDLHSAAIVLCVAGKMVVKSGAETAQLGAGEAVFTPFSAGRLNLEISAENTESPLAVVVQTQS